MNEIANLPMAEYLRLPAVSASILKTGLERCWRAAWWESWLNPNPPPPDDTAASDTGSIAHAIQLMMSEDCVAVIDPHDYPAEKTGNIPDGWTNKAIREARDQARASGLIPVLEPTMREIRAMVNAQRDFIVSLKDTEPEIFGAFMSWPSGDSELTMLWDDGPTKCRIRPDRTTKNRKLIVDLKFTGMSAEPDYWGRAQMIRGNHYIGAAFYRRGFQALFGVEPDYVYMVTETSPPYLTSLVGIEPHGYAIAAAKIETALREWARCVESGFFPGYPNRVCYPEFPAWVDSAWQERELSADPFARRVELGTQG